MGTSGKNERGGGGGGGVVGDYFFFKKTPSTVVLNVKGAPHIFFSMDPHDIHFLPPPTMTF